MYIIASSFYSAVQLKFTSTHSLESQLSMRKIHLTQRGCIDAFSVICYTSLNSKESTKCQLKKTDKNKINENKSEINKNS